MHLWSDWIQGIKKEEEPIIPRQMGQWKQLIEKEEEGRVEIYMMVWCGW